ncbi:GNAT family N-acetyltransferase [Streptomyces sp. CA-294286]|uniref:GNAT family N-acetyltransferase n=1 Tax=Streptomyces sp. CA-294286 TaxID=3240070 RepID=UPI003D9284ED
MYPVSRRSHRLELRELTLDDVEAIHAIYGSEVATEHLSFTPRAHEQVHNIVTRSIASAAADPRTEYALALVERDRGEVLGYGRLAMDPHQQRAATMGFALHPGAWGNGYGLECVQLLLGLAFEELDLHRVWGARSPHNPASAQTMHKAGMVEEGRIREHICKGGQWRDSIVHSMLETEWYRGG